MKKKKSKIVRKYATCCWATLVQYFENPILAECKCKDKRDREIADAPRACPLYMEDYRADLKVIDHRYSYSIQ